MKGGEVHFQPGNLLEHGGRAWTLSCSVRQCARENFSLYHWPRSGRWHPASFPWRFPFHCRIALGQISTYFPVSPSKTTVQNIRTTSWNVDRKHFLLASPVHQTVPYLPSISPSREEEIPSDILPQHNWKNFRHRSKRSLPQCFCMRKCANLTAWSQILAF